jgi:hypothetical protein
MFNYIKNLFKKEEPEITFWTLERGLEDVYPPIPALEALPNWFKDIPKEILPPHMNHPGTLMHPKMHLFLQIILIIN